MQTEKEMVTALRETAMLVNFTAHKWRARQSHKGAAAAAESAHGAEEGSVDAVVNLLKGNDAELKALGTALDRARAVFKRLTSPWGTGSYRLLANTMAHRFVIAMHECTVDVEKKLDALLVVYDEAVEQSKQRLGHLEMELRYPTHDEIRNKMGFEFDFIPVPDARDFKSLGHAYGFEPRMWTDFIGSVEETTAKRAERAVKDALEQAHKDAQTRIQKLVDQCTRKEGRRLYEVHLSQIEESVGLLRGVNIFNDPAIEKWCVDIERVVQRTDIDTLRKSQTERTSVGAEAQALLDSLTADGVAAE